MKIIDKINKLIDEDKSGKRSFYSFEYFPPKTDSGKQHFTQHAKVSKTSSIVSREWPT